MRVFGIDHSVVKRLLQKGYLFACFLPLTLGGVTANFLFTGLFLSGRYRSGHQVAFIVPIFGAFCIFAFAWTFFFMSPVEGLLRQTFSFGAFFLAFSLVFVRLPYSIEDILDVILLATTLYSVWVLVVIWNNPVFAIANPGGVKMGVREFVPDWPQRYLILIVFSCFYAVHKSSQHKLYFAVFFVLISCIFMSFTRSAYLAVAVGFVAYFTANLLRGGQQVGLSGKNVYYVFIALLALVVVVLVNAEVQSAILTIYDRTLQPISQFLKGQDIADKSAEVRLSYWMSTISVFEKSPLIGTGFGSIHLYDAHVGSAHNQYLDILLRTGVIGLTIYVFMWFYLMKSYARTEPYILAGLVAMFVYGFFHETTKLTYGALLYFLLLGQAFERKNALRTPTSTGTSRTNI